MDTHSASFFSFGIAIRDLDFACYLNYVDMLCIYTAFQKAHILPPARALIRRYAPNGGSSAGGLRQGAVCLLSGLRHPLSEPHPPSPFSETYYTPYSARGQLFSEKGVM